MAEAFEGIARMKKVTRAFLVIAGIAAMTVSQTAAADEATDHGKAVFDLWCRACHKPLNPGDLPVAGTSSLQRKYEGKKPAALEQRTDLTPGIIRGFVRHGIKSMPASRKTEISDADLDALIAYLSKNKAS
jgi:mono/diheme cytochrome c family protein